MECKRRNPESWHLPDSDPNAWLSSAISTRTDFDSYGPESDPDATFTRPVVNAKSVKVESEPKSPVFPWAALIRKQDTDYSIGARTEADAIKFANAYAAQGFLTWVVGKSTTPTASGSIEPVGAQCSSCFIELPESATKSVCEFCE